MIKILHFIQKLFLTKCIHSFWILASFPTFKKDKIQNVSFNIHSDYIGNSLEKVFNPLTFFKLTLNPVCALHERKEAFLNEALFGGKIMKLATLTQIFAIKFLSHVDTVGCSAHIIDQNEYVALEGVMKTQKSQEVMLAFCKVKGCSI